MRELTLDIGMMQAIIVYLSHGIHPGSMGESLLLGDIDMAMRRKHTLVPPYVVDNMFAADAGNPVIMHGQVSFRW